MKMLLHAIFAYEPGPSTFVMGVVTFGTVVICVFVAAREINKGSKND